MVQSSQSRFRIGCALWGYKEWVGDLFPTGSRSSEFLNLYSHRLTAVEGNTTFYAVPDRKTVQRWVQDTPPGFEFCLKLPQTVTHQGALEPEIPQALRFLDQMLLLGDRLGPCFAQLPPTYGPDQFEDLVAFLGGWPCDSAELAVEVRHPDWFQPRHRDRLNALLKELGIGRVLLDSRPIYEGPDDPQQHSQRRKPQVPLQPVVTAPFTLIRYISHPDLTPSEKGLPRNQPYLTEWVKQVNTWLQQGTRIYFFVHCPVEARSPQILRDFQAMLEQQSVPVPPLPWNQINQSQSEQLSLF